MTTLEEIKQPVKDHLCNYENTLSQAILSDVPLLSTILDYLHNDKGKQMRPMFVLLSAGLFGEINESSYRAASMVELLHTASLVHDDVVDDSKERRGKKSVNAIWQNKIAILVGDFLVSKGVALGIENNDFELMPILIKAGYEMSEGELLQMEKALSLDVTEDIYLKIIRKKTGSLMATCCALGATSVKADKETVDLMYEFGQNVGMAFQIRDDILDYENHINTGKPHGNDIREQKITLPLIYTLNNTSESDRQKIIDIVKNHNHQPEKVAEVIEIVNKSDGIAYSVNQINYYQEKAISLIDGIGNELFRKSLQNLVLFNTARAH